MMLVSDVESVLHRGVVKFPGVSAVHRSCFLLRWAPVCVSLQPPDAVWVWQLFKFV